ncbi:MAG: hypothetical protein LUQ27_06995 [Methanomassiliicoccales archaeon]|nr:hypothetical protein [Methanomassiliicoccales archaeon]
MLSRIFRDFKALLYHLRGDEVIDDAIFYDSMLSSCPFCGASREEDMMYSGKMSKWIRLSCGATV